MSSAISEVVATGITMAGMPITTDTEITKPTMGIVTAMTMPTVMLTIIRPVKSQRPRDDAEDDVRTEVLHSASSRC